MGITKRHAPSATGERPLTLKRIAALKLALGALALLMASSVLAQSGGGYALDPWVVAGGGAVSSSGGGFSLGSTMGQSGAGTASGGGFTIYSGFWKPTLVKKGPVYISLILRSPAATPPTACPAGEPNNKPEQSLPLPTNNGSCIGTFDNERSGETFDYYSIQVKKDQHITVKLTGIPAGADYDLYLQHQVGGPHDFKSVRISATPGSVPEQVDYDSPTSELYYIKVQLTKKLSGASNNYVLSVAVN
jgi:hypothetical protein